MHPMWVNEDHGVPEAATENKACKDGAECNLKNRNRLMQYKSRGGSGELRVRQPAGQV